MAALATEAEVDSRLGRALNSVELARVPSLLTDASAAVRGYTGQQFDLATTTARLRVRRGKVVLPQRPVVDVTAVEDTDGNEVSFTWLGDDRVDLSAHPLNEWEIEPRRYGLTMVDVTYEHGYEAVPADIVAVVTNVVLRSLGRDPEAGGVSQEAIAGYSYTVGSVGAAGALGFLPDERVVLDRYRRSGSTAMVG